MLIAVYTVITLLMLLPLLAEVRMVIRSMLTSALGKQKAQKQLAALPLTARLTLSGVRPLLTAAGGRWLREYGQYMRMQAFIVLMAVAAVALEVLFIRLRMAIPALVVCLAFCVGAFTGISLIHAHAGYDPEKRTTRYEREGN